MKDVFKVSALLFLFVFPLFSQNITRRFGQYVLVDKGQTEGITLGDCYTIYREISEVNTITVGKIKIIKFYADISAALIVEEDCGFKISPDDYILLPDISKSSIATSSLNSDISLHLKPYIEIRDNELVGFSSPDYIKFKEGIIYPVFSNLQENPVRNGTIKIIKDVHNKYVGEILEESKRNSISIFDYISNNPVKNYVFDEAELGYYHPKDKWTNYWGYASLGAGIIVSGIAYHNYSKALSKYDDYKAATTAIDAVQLHDKTLYYYNKSKTNIWIGGGLIAFGTIYSIFNRTKAQQDHELISFKSFHEKGCDGLKLEMALSKCK